MPTRGSRLLDSHQANQRRADASLAIRTASAASDLEFLCVPSEARDKLPLVTESALPSLLDGVRPYLPFVALLVVLVALLSAVAGRGPRILQRRDPWRGFKFAARRAVMTRAGGRCEAPRMGPMPGSCDRGRPRLSLVTWRRDGGEQRPSSVRFSQPSQVQPAPAVLSLERRWADHVPAGVEVRVLARMSADERLAREIDGSAQSLTGRSQTQMFAAV